MAHRDERVSGANDRIACRGCGRNIVPRLWHYGGGRLSYATTQHLCPFCGAVLYETGGGVRWGCVIVLLLFTLPFIVLFVFTLVREITKEFSR